MKTIIHSMSLGQALSTVLIGIAALWSMPGSAGAQIYVSQYGNNTVGEYNATTGAVINASLVTGVTDPEGLVLSGNTLFVANDISNGGEIGTYNATTGAPINANFITGDNAFNGPYALALLGNTLFVSDDGYRITTYDATTGSAFTTVYNPLISGLSYPYALALSGNNLYISQDYGATNWVGEYNASSGATINAQLFTTNPAGAFGLALSGNDLFVAGYQSGTVGEYNATTGAVINANFITGILDPLGLAVVGNTLYVTQYEGATPGVVSTFNATTGASIDPNFITGLNGPRFIVVASVPEPSTWSMIGVGGVASLGMILRKKHRTAFHLLYGGLRVAGPAQRRYACVSILASSFSIIAESELLRAMPMITGAIELSLKSLSYFQLWPSRGPRVAD